MPYRTNRCDKCGAPATISWMNHQAYALNERCDSCNQKEEDYYNNIRERYRKTMKITILPDRSEVYEDKPK